MIWPMANSQMETSKNPRAAAKTLRPRVRQMVRTVHSVTTHVCARNTNKGNKIGLTGATNCPPRESERCRGHTGRFPRERSHTANRKPLQAQCQAGSIPDRCDSWDGTNHKPA